MNKVLSAVLSLCVVTAAAVPAFANSTLYTNGPGLYTGVPAYSNSGPQPVNHGAIVSNSFLLSGSSIVTGAQVSLWLVPSDNLYGLDWAITSDPLGGTVFASGTATPTTETLGVSMYNYDMDVSSFSFSGVSLGAGTYYFQIGNLIVDYGDYAYWDESGGSSTAVSNVFGTVPSSAFTLYGSANTLAATPEPSSLALLGTGVLGIGGLLRRKLTSQA